ncbi:hypothetical protein MHM582_3605, partial [Microbacterium sp. HM58-2]
NKSKEKKENNNSSQIKHTTLNMPWMNHTIYKQINTWKICLLSNRDWPRRNPQLP